MIKNPDTRVIIMTMHPNTTYPIKAAAIGAKGYLIKGEDFDDLFNGIRIVNSGGTYVSPGLWN